MRCLMADEAIDLGEEDFYKEVNVFITGATGFVGKCLLEKLLWSFPQINAIYILIRSKNGNTAEQRFREFLSHKIFDRLHAKKPQRFEKLHYFAGDIESDNFGLTATDKEKLCKQVHIIFHSAATVRFNECLKVAARVNALATWNLLELCLGMRQLKSFVYVSTAYCNPGRKYVDEDIYPTLPPVEWEQFLTCVEKIPEEYFNSLANYIKGPHPNTYTFTKSVAEQIVKHYRNRLPIVIVRPSIVTAAHREPYPGWIDNVQGITGIIMEIGKGTLSSILADENIICDIIPVDYVVNAMIMIAQRATLKTVYISNATSGITNPITWARMREITVKWSRIYPTQRIQMYPYFQYRKNRRIHDLAVILLHYVPAMFMDLITMCRGKGKYMLPVAKKFRQACLVGAPFSLNEWIFLNQSRHYFYALLQAKRYPSLFWDLDQLNYEVYIRNYVIGVQKYLQREKFSENKSKWKITKIYWTWLFLHIFLILLIIYTLF